MWTSGIQFFIDKKTLIDKLKDSEAQIKASEEKISSNPGCLKHFNKILVNDKCEKAAVLEIRTHALQYIKGLKGSAKAEGVSTNFIYNDVNIKVRIKGQYQEIKYGNTYFEDEWGNGYFEGSFTDEPKEYVIDILLDTNVAGDSQETSESFYVPDGTGIYNMYYKMESTQVQYEVIEVTGSVTQVALPVN